MRLLNAHCLIEAAARDIFVFEAPCINCLSYLLACDAVHAVSKEYCNMETFNATCHRGEMVLIDEARYGRMKLGRCVTRGYGHLGCAADVRNILDARCSGRRACQFIVPDPTLYSMQPCPEDFTSYLETAYTCVEGYAAVDALRRCFFLLSAIGLLLPTRLTV